MKPARAKKTRHPAPLVSVIMGAYNAEEFICEAVRSILVQDYLPLELIVIDDASTDRTYRLLCAFKDRRLRCYRNPKNRGIPATRNRGLGLAQGRYVTFFDHDDLMLQGAIRKRVEYLEAHPEAGIAFGYIKDVIGKNGHTIPRGKAYPRSGLFESYWRNLKFCRLFRRIDYQTMKNFFFTPLAPLNNLMVRREMIRKAGCFDVSFRVTDDTDYLFKLARITPFHFVDVPVKRYRIHGKNASSRATKKIIKSERSRIERRYIHNPNDS